MCRNRHTPSVTEGDSLVTEPKSRAVKCLFCNKRQDEVGTIVVPSNDVDLGICNECFEWVKEIMEFRSENSQQNEGQ
ncbi:MAG: hypothetical protein LC674_00385 [Actinobacteria bacterium]|nr:hypothetical protein [Actinomycetota bacterium]